MTDKPQYATHQAFFAARGDEPLVVQGYGETSTLVTVEEMYQHFKARIIAEARSSENGNGNPPCDTCPTPDQCFLDGCARLQGIDGWGTPA